MLAMIIFPADMLRMDVIYCSFSSLSQYCPAILDIIDGAEMTETQLDPTNPAWVQITICLVILVFYFSSLMEMYCLKFPKQLLGRSYQREDRALTLIQLVSSVVFLVLRLVLFAHNSHEFFLVAKTTIRVFNHYQLWSNLRRGQNVVSVEATEISREKNSALK